MRDKQLVRLDQKERLWDMWIRQPEPQLIPSCDVGDASVMIDPALADAGVGEQAEFLLTTFLDERIIGSVNFIIVNK